MSPALPLAEAQERLLGAVEPLAEEVVAADLAVGRFLARPLAACRTQPAADLSAMDGYAVRADDASGPWAVVGESAAGRPFAGEIAPGQAIRLSTGAMMPDGDVLVLLQENAERSGERLALNGEGAPATRHIRRAGFDFREGDEVFAAGARIGAAQLALALSAGHATLAVRRLPRLAVIDSGDELSADPSACEPHRIPASNGAMIAAMAAPFAASVARLGPVPDTMEALAEALGRAGDADVVVTSGGASVGDHDLVRPALEQWGASIDFWRVAIKPGKPLLVARRGGQWVLGLPGNPVSSYVTAFLFLLPLLRALGGAPAFSALPSAICARLEAPLPATGDRAEFVRAVYADGAVRPLGQQDSSALRSLAACNALVVRDPHAPGALAGEEVRLHLLEGGGIA